MRGEFDGAHRTVRDLGIGIVSPHFFCIVSPYFFEVECLGGLSRRSGRTRCQLLPRDRNKALCAGASRRKNADETSALRRHRFGGEIHPLPIFKFGRCRRAQRVAETMAPERGRLVRLLAPVGAVGGQRRIFLIVKIDFPM
jgi:hypothetical protein